VGSRWLEAPFVGPYQKVEEIVPFLDNSLAQEGEDVFAHEHYFWRRERGSERPIVLESGGLDGMLFSNSYAFEQSLGWRALHIEAGPSNYELLIENRPLSLNIHTALCATLSTLHFLQHYPKDPVAGIFEFMSAGFKSKFWNDLNANVTADPRATLISCTPLALLLDRFHVRHIDLWVLDVEGAELSVLQGNPNPCVICPDGYISSNEGAAFCSPCSSGTTSSPDHQSCIAASLTQTNSPTTTPTISPSNSRTPYIATTTTPTTTRVLSSSTSSTEAPIPSTTGSSQSLAGGLSTSASAGLSAGVSAGVSLGISLLVFFALEQLRAAKTPFLKNEYSELRAN